MAHTGIVDTRLLAQPAVSASRIAFLYAGDLWTSRHDGSDVRRITTADGDETNPVFSRDGQWLAFAGNYDGNVDVYVVPAGGGEPRRLTWHPGDDLPQDFSPDGTTVLFTSDRADFSMRYTQLWTVPISGGPATKLPIPNAAQATYSPDGRWIAYNPIGRRFEQWKGYRGGTVSQLWLIDTRTWEVEKIPQPAGRSNDVDAMWLEPGAVWFRSDRDGEFNLYRYDRSSKAVTQVTHHADLQVMAASAGSGKIAYEQAGWLHLLDPATGQAHKMTIGVTADLRETRPRWVKGADFVRDASLSPSGARVAFEIRGEIVTVPAEKGDPRNLSSTPAVHERSPAWSPDGKQVAYLSDQGGEYRLHILPQDGKGRARVVSLTGAGFYEGLRWSPDGKRIAYTDNSHSLFVLDVASGQSARVGGHKIYTGPVLGPPEYSWSPDSRWLAYWVSTQPLVTMLFLYDADQNRSTALTDGLSEVSQPVFERNGKYLYLLASTDSGPKLDWFAQSRYGFRHTRGIYAIALTKDAPNPFERENNEERAQTSLTGSSKPDAGPPARPAATVVDFDGIAQRIVAFPVEPAEILQLEVGDENQVYYLRYADGKEAIHRHDITNRKDEIILPEAGRFELTADGKKLLYQKENNWFIASTEQPKAGDGRIDLGPVDLWIEPRAEWAQIYDEAWRFNRDYFYASNYHGVDWNAQKVKYAPLLAAASNRGDVERVIGWLLSELRVGHSFQDPGQRLVDPVKVGVGLLGADFEVASGRYRFSQVFGGLNWDPNLRAPLTEPGVNVRAGEYLLAVNGVPIQPPTSVYSRFENTVGRSVELTVGPNANGAGSRTLTVVPIDSEKEKALRNRFWVEDNLRKVDAATGGRVAYVYVPDTAIDGYDAFKRYFYPQAHKDAIILDERFNGGGRLPDYYVDILARRTMSYWSMRYGDDLRTPAASIDGPKVLLANETAGSCGDYLAWMFRQMKLGPVIGQRTWGGMVGVLSTPVLMDGGRITAPNLALWVPERGFVIENEGVPPDIEVEQTPKDVIAGRDPQLEKAIAWVMEELRKHPQVKPTRPPFPDKMKQPVAKKPLATSFTSATVPAPASP